MVEGSELMYARGVKGVARAVREALPETNSCTDERETVTRDARRVERVKWLHKDMHAP